MSGSKARCALIFLLFNGVKLTDELFHPAVGRNPRSWRSLIAQSSYPSSQRAGHLLTLGYVLLITKAYLESSILLVPVKLLLRWACMQSEHLDIYFKTNLQPSDGTRCPTQPGCTSFKVTDVIHKQR